MRELFNIESPFMQLLTRVGDLIIVNVLYLLCCVPIVTIGAATAALHKVGQAIVYDTDNGIAKTFFRAFRENFKQATALWLMMAVFAAAMVCNYLLISGFVVGTPATVLKGALVVAIGLVLVLAAYMFPLMVRYTNTMRELAVNALDRMEHGGDTYRRQAGNFQGFDLRMNPCTTMCLCMLCNRICPGLGYWFLCC